VRKRIADLEIGSDVVLTIKRGAETLKMPMKTAKLESAVGEEKEFKIWGITVRDISRRMRMSGSWMMTRGWWSPVEPGISGAKAELGNDDVIVRVNEKEVEDLDAFTKIYEETKLNVALGRVSASWCARRASTPGSAATRPGTLRASPRRRASCSPPPGSILGSSRRSAFPRPGRSIRPAGGARRAEPARLARGADLGSARARLRPPGAARERRERGGARRVALRRRSRLARVRVLTMSTGVGAGFIFDGSLYRGARYGAGEVGHIAGRARRPRLRLRPARLSRGVHRRRRARRAHPRRRGGRRGTSLVERAGGDPARISAEHWVEALRAAEPYAQRLANEYLDVLAQALAI